MGPGVWIPKTVGAPMADWRVKKERRYTVVPTIAAVLTGLLIRRFGLRGLSRESGVDPAALRKLDRQLIGQVEAATVEGLAQATQAAVTTRFPGHSASMARSMGQWLTFLFQNAFQPGPLVKRPAHVVSPQLLPPTQAIEMDRWENKRWYANWLARHPGPTPTITERLRTHPLSAAVLRTMSGKPPHL